MIALRTVIGLGCLLLCGEAFSQCPDAFKLIRKDTTVRAGIYIVEPPPGTQAKVTFEPIPPVIYDTVFAKTGTWTYAKNTADPFLNNTVYFSNQIGATLIYNVYGRSFEIVTALAGHHGSIGVSLNNGPEVLVNLYSGTRVNDKVVYSAPMPFGTNTIKLRVVKAYGVIDFIRCFQ